MTPEFGAASQLEKIDMLDFAEFVVINKFDRKGAADALRDVAKQVQRNRNAFAKPPGEMPVFGTMASRFNDDGVTSLYHAMLPRLAALGLAVQPSTLPNVETRHSTHQVPIVPPSRVRYLADIADTVRAYKRDAIASARLAREVQQLRASSRMLGEAKADKGKAAIDALEKLADERESRLDGRARQLLAMWPDMQQAYAGDEYVVKIRDREIRTALVSTTLAGNKIARSRCRPTRTRRDPQVAAARQRPGLVPLHRRARSPSSARTRTRRGCSPAKAMPSAPTAASSSSRRECPRSASRPRSTR
jgi:methylmalonyl-CoA mutase